MIILFNPRATRPRNRRLPLAVLAIAAVLEGREDYEIVDGNVDDNSNRHHFATYRATRGRVARRLCNARPADGCGDGDIA